MKKLVVAVATVFVVAAVLVGGATVDRGGTLVASGFACNVVDGNGALFTTFSSEQWLYQNKAVLRCSGDGAASTPPSLIFWNNGNWPPPGGGGSCGTLFGSTTNWVDKVGYNGNSQLTCTVVGEFDAANAAAAGAGLG